MINTQFYAAKLRVFIEGSSDNLSGTHTPVTVFADPSLRTLTPVSTHQVNAFTTV